MCIGQLLITNLCSFLLIGVVGGSELANGMRTCVWEDCGRYMSCIVLDEPLFHGCSVLVTKQEIKEIPFTFKSITFMLS